MPTGELPIPDHFDPRRLGEVYRVSYPERAAEARAWARLHGVRPAADDRRRIGVLLVDVQNTFCVPGFELFVAGRSGRGAIEDGARLAAFLYRNLGRLTAIHATLDTHAASQIFHPLFLVGEDGEPPEPMTAVSVEDVEKGRLRVNPDLERALAPGEPGSLEAHLLHYVRALRAGGKYDLMVWPYHAMLGGIGHALVSAVEEAVFFHSVARSSPTRFSPKGSHALTESYSALGPEVRTDARGRPIGHVDEILVETLLGYDALIVAGQAKSHCVAWTVADLLDEAAGRGPDGAGRIYLLDDCTSPVVVPGVADFTDQAENAFARFAAAGAHRVRSTEPMMCWPGFPSSAPEHRTDGAS